MAERTRGDAEVEDVRSIVVGLATFRRPELLDELLPRLVAQIDEVLALPDGPAEAGIVVVDNDPDGSAREVVDSAGDPRIRYAIEPTPGISSARNRVLDEAGAADVLVLLDDDETPQEDWLAALLRARREHRADAVSGPVQAVFEGGEEDPWVAASGVYGVPLRLGTPTGTALRRAATNNLLLDLRTVRRLGLRFDLRFGLTGGEDSLFTGQLTGAGGRLVWCAEALVDDIVPAARNTRRFQLERRFAQSATIVKVERELAGGASPLRRGARWTVTGAAQLAKGVVLTLLGLLRRDLVHTAQGEGRIAGGLGVLAGVLGLSSSPYAKARRPRRR